MLFWVIFDMYINNIYFGKLRLLVVNNTKEGYFLSISNENGDITICVNISEIRVLPPSEFFIFGMYGCKGRTYKKKIKIPKTLK